MSLVEVLPEVQSLSQVDKIRLIQFLAQQLERESGGMIEPGRSYPLPSPNRAFTAAAALLQALEEDRGQPSAPGPTISLRAARPVARAGQPGADVAADLDGASQHYDIWSRG